jgi:hypothetical protein
MGEVYRARGTRLQGEVAVKVLPAELSSAAGRLRGFETEARSTSALNHPNIVTIHEVGESDSTSFIVMELVEGKTLRELLHTGPLPVRKFLDEYENAPTDEGFAFDDSAPMSSTIHVGGGVITIITGATACTPDSTTLCVDDQPGDRRFRIEGASRRPGAEARAARRTRSRSRRSASIREDCVVLLGQRPELLLKVVNGCTLNDHCWFFASAGRNVGLAIAVTDARTGTVKPYANADQQAFPPIQDTSAFACH